MGYSAGNLELSILGFSTKAVNSINATANALRGLASAIEKVSNAQFALAGRKLESIFSKIAKATNSINTKNIKNLASAANSLSSISRMANLNDMDFGKVAKGFETLTVSIRPFVDMIKEAEKSFASFERILKFSNRSKVKGVFGENIQVPKINTSELLNIGKLGSAFYLLRKIGNKVADIVQSGSDFTETLNLWSVAMDENISKATLFVNKMNEAYGVSKKTLMNSQAVFKNMLGSLGQISDDVAYQLSEGITQMALDYASLYNVGIETAMTKFQAVLAGQVRPIRTESGFDITEGTLFELYKSIGGTKTIRQLSRAEKQLLSIYAIYEQMSRSGTIGDFERTIESFANQTRILKDGWQDLKSYTGLILVDLIETSNVMKILNNAISYISGFFEAMANFMGAIKTYGTGDPLSGLETGATNSLETIEQISGLLDFDKIRSLEATEQSQSVDIDIDENLRKALTGYDGLIDKALEKTTKISDEWLEIIGITKDAETGMVTYSARAEGVFEIFTLLGSVVSGFVSILLGKSLITVLGKVASKLSVVSGLFKSTFSKNLGIIAVISALTYLYQTNDDFKASVDRILPALLNLLNSGLKPLLQVIALVGKTITTLLEIIAPILTFIINIAAGIIEGLEALHLLDIALYGLLGVLTLIYAMKFATTIKTWFDNFSSLIPVAKKAASALKDIANSTNMLWLGIGLLVAGIGTFVANFSQLGNTAKWLIPIIASLAGVVAALAAGFTILKGNWAGAIGIGALVAGIGLTVGTQLAVPNYEMGASDIDSGTVFRAGEFGKTEAVYTGSNGKTNVANIQQMKAAELQALNEWWATAKNDIPVFTGVSDSGIYTMVEGEARRRGKQFSKV